MKRVEPGARRTGRGNAGGLGEGLGRKRGAAKRATRLVATKMAGARAAHDEVIHRGLSERGLWHR